MKEIVYKKYKSNIGFANKFCRTIKHVGLILGLTVMIMSSLSCATQHRNSQKDILPRQSFMKIEKQLTIYRCLDENSCFSKNFGSSASGMVVSNQFDGAYVLTAEHVCNDNVVDQIRKHFQFDRYDLVFKVFDIDGNEYSVEIVNLDSPNDICILWAKDLYKPAVKISPKAPEPGDRLYNIAAPLGIFAPHMIPINEGLYNGYWENRSFYSIPAVGGSSGSAVLNHKGELVGMIHSVYVRFASLSMGPTYHDLTSFINSSIKNEN